MIGAVQTEREAALFLSGVIPALCREHSNTVKKPKPGDMNDLKTGHLAAGLMTRCAINSSSCRQIIAMGWLVSVGTY